MSIGAIVLAAGSSSRMGRTKQLISLGGQSLVRRAAMAAIDGGCDPVTVVTGSHEAVVVEALKGLKVRIASNAAWELGMGTSLRAGLADLRAADSDLAAVAVILCDQPNVSSDLIRRLLDAFATGRKPMAACEYAGTIGPPCCFDRSMFPALVNISDQHGAKTLLLAHPADVAHVPWEEGGVDLDTEEDCRSFFNSMNDK
jgi:molybdenum cofactor cytidylyltransferase